MPPATPWWVVQGAAGAERSELALDGITTGVAPALFHIRSPPVSQAREELKISRFTYLRNELTYMKIFATDRLTIRSTNVVADVGGGWPQARDELRAFMIALRSSGMGCAVNHGDDRTAQS